MKILELSDEQIEYLYILLDSDLKSNGLSSLSRVVDFHNVLLSAKKVETREVIEDVDQPERVNSSREE